MDRESPTRINRYLADCGLGSRRSCESLVTEGRVTLNGEPCLALSTRVAPGDSVAVDGRLVHRDEQQITLLLNKPAGHLCTRNDPQGRPTIFDLLPPHLQNLRALHHAGRLDLDSEGLIILSSDGGFSQDLTHPTKHIEKEYFITLKNSFRPDHAELLCRGFDIPAGFARAKAVVKISKRKIAITLEQGLNRQVRHMLEHLGYRVGRLIRIRIGGLTDPDLPPGGWRQLGKRDRRALFGETKH